MNILKVIILCIPMFLLNCIQDSDKNTKNITIEPNSLKFKRNSDNIANLQFHDINIQKLDSISCKNSYGYTGLLKFLIDGDTLSNTTKDYTFKNKNEHEINILYYDPCPQCVLKWNSIELTINFYFGKKQGKLKVSWENDN